MLVQRLHLSFHSELVELPQRGLGPGGQGSGQPRDKESGETSPLAKMVAGKGSYTEALKARNMNGQGPSGTES